MKCHLKLDYKYSPLLPMHMYLNPQKPTKPIERDSRNMKVARNQRLAAAGNNVLEAIARLGGGGEGPKKMKILVRKEDLNQLMEAIRDGRCRRGPPPNAAALEQRLNSLRQRQFMRTRSGSWRPVLQSIPEEVN